MIRNYYIIAILTSLFLQSNAQIKSYTDLSSTLIAADFTGLNRQIKGMYPELGNNIMELSIGRAMVAKKVKYGFRAHYSTVLNSGIGQKQTLFNGYGVGLMYSYDIISKKSFFLFPKIGVGVRRYNLTLGETSNGVSIEDVLNYPVNNYKFINKGGYLDIGLGIEKYFSILFYQLSAGMAIGYRMDKGDWLYQESNPVYQEIAKLGGFFVSFGGKIRIQRKKSGED